MKERKNCRKYREDMLCMIKRKKREKGTEKKWPELKIQAELTQATL